MRRAFTPFLVGVWFGLAWQHEALADDELAPERTLLEVIQSTRLEGGEEGEEAEEKVKPSEETTSQPEAENGKKKRPWAILPQVGFSPEKGANGGIKFTDRDLTSQHLTLDVAASGAVMGQRHLDTSVVAPRLFGEWVVALVEGEYFFDPTKEFFGLGNNDVGPDELSTNEYQQVFGTVALALRASRRFSLVLSGAYNEHQIHRGDLHDDTPSTVDAFPGLTGIRGGTTNPLSVAVLFNDRKDVTRPTRGWSVIAKAQRIDRGLGNDFEFNRYLLDASYLYPLLTRRQVLGVRLGGEYIDGKRRHVPFYEFASLGGDRDLRGYFKDRFLGESNVIGGGEYRLKVFDFNFFDLWQVKIDGVGFADAGRVFFDEEDIVAEIGLPPESIPPTSDEFRYSYGGGMRIALGEAILARLDVGFSEEEHGLVYLVFGHTF